jgi:hypothetical protein
MKTSMVIEESGIAGPSPVLQEMAVFRGEYSREIPARKSWEFFCENLLTTIQKHDVHTPYARTPPSGYALSPP